MSNVIDSFVSGNLPMKQDEEDRDEQIEYTVKVGSDKNALPEATTVQTVGLPHEGAPMKGQLPKSPEETAGFFSRTFFIWINRLFKTSKRKRKVGEELEQADLWQLAKRDETEHIGKIFDKGWFSAKQRIQIKNGGDGKPTGNNLPPTELEAYAMLKNALLCVIGTQLKWSALFLVGSSFAQFTFPLLLAQILDYIVAVETREQWEGFALVGCVVAAMWLKSIFENQYFFRQVRCSYQTRSVVSSTVYRKSLRLSSSSRQGKTVGEIVNIMQLDANKMEQFVMQLHPLWNGLLQITAYLGLLYYYIGWATFVGLAVMIFSVPMNVIIMAKLFKIINKMVLETDTRVKVTNECLQGMLGIKMAAWEESFLKMIQETRDDEIKLLRKTVYLRAFFSAFVSAVPAITAGCAVAAYALTGGDVNATSLFAAISTFEQLRIPLLIYPQAIAAYVQARVSARRVANFLSLEEVAALKDDDDVVSASKANVPSDSSTAIKISDGDFFWSNPTLAKPPAVKNKATDKNKKNKNSRISSTNPVFDSSSGSSSAAQLPVLRDVNVSIARGSLTAIVGPVGSGKSSFCNAILGEMFQANGAVNVHGSVAYAAQSPWILNATVRDNILFGEAFDEKRYWRVMDACQLTHDLDILTSGDQTMIGERGINLSGGQKQRISVARAAYSRKEIVILDDPLSALDPGVAAKMFKECVVKFLGDRTRVLVTNQLNFLKNCDWIVVLASNNQTLDSDNALPTSAVIVSVDGESDEDSAATSGYIAEQGTFPDLNNAGLDFASMFERFGATGTQRRQSSAEGGDEEDVVDDAANAEAAKKGQAVKTGDVLMSTEERSRGAVSFSEYSSYIKAGGGWIIFGFIYSLFIMTQLSTIFATQWIGIWTRAAVNGYEDFENSYGIEVVLGDNETIADSYVPVVFYISVYGGIAVFLALASFCRTVGLMVFGLRAAITMHQGLLERILGAPMSFFDQTPIGRIISRFSKDMYQVDNELTQFFQFFLFTTLNVFATLAVISFSTPYFLAAIPPLAIIYYIVLQQFRPVTREMKRLEAISRSPIYAGFSETLGGLSTIRAFGQAKTFDKKNAAKVDLNILNFAIMRTADRWLGLRLEFIGSIVAALAALLAVIGAQTGTLDASQAGVSLTLSFSVTTFLTFTVRSMAELESGMNAVERLTYYANSVEQEKPRKSEQPPPKSWPTKGEIVLKDLSMRYRPDTPLVIKSISLTIQGGHRVGVVGRTGSGKSSLMMVLLRLVEPEFDGPNGPIFLDGVDITKIGLLELRRKISIVPQSPVIFSGTLRSNLDPFNEYTDANIWDALDKCNLKSMVVEYPEKLQHPASEYGENFSQGQRQLLCLARSLLEKCQVLMLDEATSSVDFETDELIQKTIRSEDTFGGCTVLTIAHRINTVIDSDRILVLDAGVVAEYDEPKVLLADPNSIFSTMASGREVAPAGNK